MHLSLRWCALFAAAGASVLGGNAAYTAKMDEHMKEQQQQLEAAQAALSAAQQAEGMIRWVAPVNSTTGQHRLWQQPQLSAN